MKKITVILAVLVSLVSVSNAADIVSAVECGSNGTYNDFGRRDADYYFNVEDPVVGGSYECWSAAKWTGLPVPGEGESYQLDSATVTLHQANAGFTANGTVNVYVMPDSFNPGTNASYNDWAGTYASQSTLIGTYNFVQVSNGHEDVIDINNPALASSLADGTVVLAFVDSGTPVGATWAGNTSYNYAGPILDVAGSGGTGDDSSAKTGADDCGGGTLRLPPYTLNPSYIDVETRISMDYAYWGLVRWDLTGVRKELVEKIGSDLDITKVELIMLSTPYTYSQSGYVDVRFTNDDTSDYNTFYNLSDGYSDPVGGQLVNGVDSNGDPNTNGTFLNTIFYENPTDGNDISVTYTLYDAADATPPTEGQQMLIEDILADTTTTLCFVDNPTDFTVSAAWAGPGWNTGGNRPALKITAVAGSTHVVVCTNQPQFDVTGPEGVPDCTVNLYDFAEFVSEWLVCGYPDPADCM